MFCKAAILFEHNKELVIDKINLPPLKKGQVLVKILFSGICQTQILEINGCKDNQKYLPHCLGHEASGIVVDIGEGVTKVKKNNKVVLTWIKAHGYEGGASDYVCKGNKINAGPITTFSEYSVISENRLYRLKYDLSMEEAALLGCAIPTGLGAIFNVAKPNKDQSIGIFGCGGIGLLSLQAAKICGCNPIYAFDLFDSKLEIAKKLGATYTINVTDSNYKKIENELDFAIEASGNSKAMVSALEAVKPFTGIAILVGNIHHKSEISINPRQFNLGKKIFGTWGGNSNPDEHYEFFEKLIFDKKLDLEFLKSSIYKLDNINDAISDLQKGIVIRPLLKM